MHPDQGTTGDESLLVAWEELAAEAQARPWLLKLLVARGAALATRYALWKERLGRLRQGERKRLQRRLGMSLAGAALLLALAATPGLGAPAAAITVTNGTGTIANGDGCSLPEAIINANANNQSGSTDCVSGAAGLDTITLQTNVGLTAVLPSITTAITIEGGGNTISRTSGTFRILAVTSGGNLTLNSATVSGGIASGIFPTSAGGGIYARNATLAVSNSTVSGNSATSHGGGIFALSATLAVSNSNISSNLVSSGFGGGILASFAQVTVTNSTLSGNTASGGGSLGRGGALYAGIATLTIVNSTLSGNSGMSGGGTFASSSSLAITNSTLSDNLASSSGGGIYARRATLAVANSTVSGNSASFAGGGIYLYLVGGAITALNSIVASQTAGVDCNTALTSGGHNIESGTSCGFTGTDDQQSTNPKLNALSGGVQVPQNDSPAIDAGNPATPGSGGSACLSADQRGQARNDLRCDIGAVEVKLADTATVTKNVGAAGTFTFGPTLAKIVVTTKGTLSQLSVQHHSGDHANATQMNGQWWGITPTGSGFTANLDLPHTVSPDTNAKVCKHESSSDWDCDRSGSSATRVWRDGVTAFSDWAVGDNVTANVITLQDFKATGRGIGLAGWWGAVLAGLGGLGLSAFFARRLGWRRQGSGHSASAPPLAAPLAVEAGTLADDSTPAYTPPAISSRGQLKHFAGSPLVVDPLALTEQ